MLEIQKALQAIDPRYADPRHVLFVLEKSGVIGPDQLKQSQHPEYPELFLFDYTIFADFNNPIIRECRGLVLDSTNNEWNPVCWPFEKFMNWTQPGCDPIDWDSAKVYEKLDGSLLSCWYHKGKWNCSTTGSPNAGGQVNDSKITFSGLFWKVFEEKGYQLPEIFSKSFRDITFMFELMTPLNQIVVRHDTNKLVLIGARNRVTGQELPIWGFRNCYGIVNQFDLKNIDQINDLLKDKSPFVQEGFIVVDKFWKRAKVKSSAYVRAHHLKSTFSTKNCLTLELKNETEELLTYFPEFKQEIERIRFNISEFEQKSLELYNQIKDLPTQKDFALEATKHKCKGFLFLYKKGDVINARNYLNKISIYNALDLLDLLFN